MYNVLYNLCRTTIYDFDSELLIIYYLEKIILEKYELYLKRLN